MRCRKFRIWQKNKMKLKISVLIFFVVIILMLTFLIKLNNMLKPVVSMQAEHYAVMTANKIIEKAVSEYITDKTPDYKDLAIISYNGNGEPVSLELNSVNVNKIQSELALSITKEFENKCRRYHKIPLGSLTDSYLLSGKGPEIKIKICPLESVDVKLESKFESAGINQTRHSVTAVITAHISSSVPLYNFETKAEFNYLIAENIIIGSVPDIEKCGLY